MKKLIIAIVFLLSAGNTFAQHLPTNTWGVRSVVREGAPGYSDDVNRYLTTAADPLCHPGYNIGEILSYTQLTDNGARVGTDLNDLTEYVGVGDWRANVSLTPQRGFYNRRDGTNNVGVPTTTWIKIGQQGDPRFCNNEITSIRNVRISNVNNQFDRIHFTYSSLNSTRVRVIVSGDRGIDPDGSAGSWRVPIRWVENGGEANELTAQHSDNSASYSVLVPKRTVGTVYRLHLSPGENQDQAGFMEDVLDEAQFIIPGHQLIKVSSKEMKIILASTETDGAALRLSRIRRGGGSNRDYPNNYYSYGRYRDRFSDRQFAQGRIREYTVRFHTGDLLPYEAVGFSYNKGSASGNGTQLNGPVINYSWTNNGSRDRDDSRIRLSWDIDLPTGWHIDNLSSQIIRLWSDDKHRAGGITNTTWTIFPSVSNKSNFLESGRDITIWNWADNDWEIGVRFVYDGVTYNIKLEDHVAHGSGRPEAGPREGGLRNGLRAVVINADTRGGSHGGSINFNTNYGCRQLLDDMGCSRD